jgi:glycosyltransferase involved in cell wall biosynthesis
MKVSVVTVCFNSAATIGDTLDSVRRQTHPDIEHIVVDGSSTDATMSVVRNHATASTVIVSEPDRGIYDAMNKGIRLASGAVVGILNADDVLVDDTTISRLVADFEAHGADVDGLYGDIVHVDRDDLSVVTRYSCAKRFARWQIRFGLMFPHPGFYVRRELYERFGLYKLGYRVSADFELMARFMGRGARLAYHPHVVVKMREGGISTTGLWWRLHQNLEIVRACRENGIRTNIALISLKLPSKALSYARSAWSR